MYHFLTWKSNGFIITETSIGPYPLKVDGELFNSTPESHFMKHSPFRFTFIVVVLVLLNSNYAMSKRIRDDGPSGTSPLYTMADKPQNRSETFLDTLNRVHEFSLTEKDFTSIIVESTVTQASQSTAAASEAPNGFRVQVIASSQIEKVRTEQKSLESRVTYPLYIIVTPPYYKLLAGDFVKKSEAEAAAAKLKDLGYADAWVVRSKIWTGR